MNIHAVIASRLNLPVKNVSATIKLLDEGATIPFISRYRKEVTGNLDEVQIFSIQKNLKDLTELEQCKATVIAAIENAGKLTDEIRSRIENLESPTELEDIYLPYKPKRRTRAQMARELGLEPLARMIMSSGCSNIDSCASRFVKGDVKNSQQALDGASDIIAEWASENERVRNRVRSLFNRKAIIKSSLVKGKEDDTKYVDYHDYSGDLKKCPSHRFLAIQRAEKENILKVTIEVDNSEGIDTVRQSFGRNVSAAARDFVSAASADAYTRLLKPSIENETLSQAKQKADKEAINIFSENLRALLMGAPLVGKAILSIDPGYRTGCKVVCLDAQGHLLENSVIYPTPPRNDRTAASIIVKKLVKKYNIGAIAVGNGTASRETEQFLKSIEWENIPVPEIHVVNEAGASVYSASEVARKEFPEYDVTVRGAVSIGRRLIDPMAELVKIDPKSIGVGQYQHDVDQTELKESLQLTVETCVNSVGINLNSASPQLLSYVAGIGPKLAESIVEYRTQNGPFATRADLLKVPRLGPKVYTQAAGFLRIPESKNPLDNTAVHPERYALVKQMAAAAGCTVAKLIESASARKELDLNHYIN
ncbi:MAG: helix-hairpin-helix domain-containing protein, partial [Muribaculaceae bacterium]|nr:helix-hairpin-helix domain-containing protein [Muribaculaceae bacterium]